MSPLRQKQNKRKGKNAKGKPSPNPMNALKDHAHGPSLRSLLIHKTKEWISKSLKGISVRMSGCRSIAGSMTVEASLVLPLFLIFFLNLGSAMEMMRLHGKVEAALWETGRELSVYGSLLQKEESAASGAEAAESLFSYAYVKLRVENILGKKYLESAPLEAGSRGLRYLEMDPADVEECIEIAVAYKAEPLWMLPGFHGFFMENHYYARRWTGYRIPEQEGGYFLAENATVYHSSSECTHLRLNVRMIHRQQLGAERNAEGMRYRACEKCCRDLTDEILWLSEEGECYHTRRECSGLKRAYREVDWTEARKYPPCLRCVGKGEE